MPDLTWNHSICCAAAVTQPTHAMIVFPPRAEIKSWHPFFLVFEDPVILKGRGVFNVIFFLVFMPPFSQSNTHTQPNNNKDESSSSWFRCPGGQRIVWVDLACSPCVWKGSLFLPPTGRRRAFVDFKSTTGWKDVAFHLRQESELGIMSQLSYQRSSSKVGKTRYFGTNLLG